MKSRSAQNRLERGQILPIVVLMLLGIVAMVALLIDGGAIMSNRRTAQAAADAGALAGAKRMCLGMADYVTVAQEYAGKNGATSADVTTYLGDVKTLTVTANVTQASFFAGVLGHDSLPASAVATAGCMPPSGLKVLPIAWACKYTDADDVSGSPDCLVNYLDWLTEAKPMIGHFSKTGIDFPGRLYVVMDSMKTSVDSFYYCADPADPNPPVEEMDCDLNDDGINDVMAQGDRSWLDLDGGLQDASDTAPITSNGANALKQWIAGNGVPKLAIHTWLGGQTGVSTAIYKTIQTEVVDKNRVAIIPVFDGWCPVNPDVDTSDPSCIEVVHAAEYAKDPNLVGADHEPIKVSPGAGEYFHIIGFSAFFATCVDDGGGQNKCPGAKEMIAQNTAPGGAWESMKGSIKIKSFEGYFIKGYPLTSSTPGTGGVDLGLYTVTLLPD